MKISFLDAATGETVSRGMTADEVAEFEEQLPQSPTITEYENAIQSLVDRTARERQFRDGVKLASYTASTKPKWRLRLKLSSHGGIMSGHTLTGSWPRFRPAGDLSLLS